MYFTILSTAIKKAHKTKLEGCDREISKDFRQIYLDTMIQHDQLAHRVPIYSN